MAFWWECPSIRGTIVPHWKNSQVSVMGVKHHYQQHSNYVISQQVSLNLGENWSTLTSFKRTKLYKHDRAPDKLRICVFYAMKTSKNACITGIRSECTHYAYILLCKQTFQIRSVLVVVYITIHFCLWEIPRNYFPLYFSKKRAYTTEGYWMLAFLSIDVKRDLIGCLR